MPEMHDVDSSNIEAIGYDRDRQELHVRFLQSGTYLYFGVDEAVFDSFLGAPSKGTFFHENVRDQYPFERP